MDHPLEQFRDGNVDAFEELFRQHQAEVRAWILRIVRDAAAADDLTIETFWRVWKSRAGFRVALPFGAWLRKIATNAAISHLRANRREVPLTRELRGKEPEAGEWKNDVERALRSLPEKLQAPLVLALVEERPYAEIAAALGIPVGTVKSRVSRGSELLRRKLESMGIRP